MAKLTAKTQKWFTIPGDPDGAQLQILHLKPGEIQRIESETTRWLGKTVDEKFIPEFEYKPQQQLRRLRQTALVGWKGFYGVDGEELDCTPKFKDLYLDEDPSLGTEELKLSEWIDKFRNELADSLKPQEEEAEKN